VRGSTLGRRASVTALLALLGAAPALAPAPVVEPAAGGQAGTAPELERLRVDLDGRFAAAPALRGAHAGFLALDTASGTVLYARNADDEFQPASTLKLLVGSVALERLGPQYRFRTVLATLGPATALGVAATLIGGGDPLLTSDDLNAAAAALAGADVRSLAALAVDDGRYEAAPYPAGWTWDDFAYDYAVPVSALTVDENVVHVSFGVAGGGVVPLPDSALAADSLLACGGDPAPAAGGGARAGVAGSEDSLDTLTVAPDCATLTGSLPAGGTTSLDVAVRNAGVAAFGRLAQALRAHAIALPAGAAPVVTHAGAPGPGSTVLWSHDSAPFASWLGPRFWIPSDNLFAELLLRELAFTAGGRPGTTAAGLALERSWLASIGVDPATTSLADGCGMSQYDRVTPRDLVAILQHDWQGPNRQLILDSLPVGGARGTIEGIAGTPAAGRTFAKTGSMMHVRGLAGFLATRRHGAVTFAFNVDDWIGDYPALAAFRAAVLSRVVDD
jgi:D-alanyl-D-alanine carboxypeptidase/D-alanyl-D-alanine-endopeptidase (penicillin-binding protein 4)